MGKHSMIQKVLNATADPAALVESFSLGGEEHKQHPRGHESKRTRDPFPQLINCHIGRKDHTLGLAAPKVI